MYRPEVHKTVKRVQVLEKLDFDLTITDEAYRSEHTPSGEVRVFTKAEDEAVRNREHPPRHPLGAIAESIGSDDGNPSSFPGTEFYVGFARTPPLEQDEEGVREDHVTEAVELDMEGLPSDGNGTVAFDADWDVEEAKESLANNETHYEVEEYDIEGFPSDQLPVIVRAELERDAARWAEKKGLPTAFVQRLEGMATLDLELEYRDSMPGRRRLRTDRFRVDMSRTFPDIRFYPDDTSSYDPENQRVEWSNARIESGDAQSFAIIGPIGELLDIDSISAELQAHIDDHSLTGLKIKGIFDGSGEKFPQSSAVEAERKVTITCDIDIDPSALRGESREVSEATFTVGAAPHEIYDELESVCRRNNIHIRRQVGLDSDDAKPVPNRDGVFDYPDPGKFEVRREFGDRGVVYATIEVDGQYTTVSQESQVSAFDESEDRLVRADEGALDTRGRTTVEIRARSADSHLNSEFISTIETELGEGGEY